MERTNDNVDVLRHNNNREESLKPPSILSQTKEANSSGHVKLGRAEQTCDDQRVYVTGFKLGIVVSSICLSCFLMLLDTMVISTAIPHITDTFNSLQDVGWYASAYLFGSAAPQPLAGKLYTHFSTKWTFLTFFGIFELGSVLCGAAVSSHMLIVSRAVAGFGAAGIITGAITIISNCAPLEKRATLLGIVMGFNQFGLVIGPLVGGAFTSYSSWRWCFFINLPLGAIAVVVILLLYIPEQTPKSSALTVLRSLHRHLDLTGFLLFAPAVLELLLALQYGGNHYAWNSSPVIGLFCGSAVTFLLFFLWNRHRGNDALIPHGMISQPAVWSSGLYQAFLMAAVYATIYYLPIYFQSIKNASPMLSGIYLLPTIVLQLVLSMMSGALIARIGYVIPSAVISTVFLTIAIGLYSLLQPGSSASAWIGFQIIGGIGSGAGLQVAIIAVQAVVKGKNLPSSMAFIVFAQSLGPAIALALCNVLFVASLKTEIGRQVPHANATAIIKAGATGFRSIVQVDDLPDILNAYANSIDRVFYFAAALSGARVFVLWGMGWHNVRPKAANLTGTEKDGNS